MHEPSAQKIVLVVEDAIPDFMLLESAFEAAGLGHRLVHLRNGRDAIAYLGGKPPYQDRVEWPLPDLILLDGKLPGMSGLDLLRAIRGDSTLRVPIVMFSGSELPGDAQNCIASGAEEYLAKPQEMSDLVAMVRTIHYRWLSPKRS